MKNYFPRAAKYGLFLILLLLVMMFFLQAIGYAALPLKAYLTGREGLLMLGVVIFFALLYPFLGYTNRRLTFNATERVEDVERVMAMCGYRRVAETPDTDMVFESVSKVKRFILFYEGPVRITTVGSVSTIEGNRKEVVRAYYRMGTYIL